MIRVTQFSDLHFSTPGNRSHGGMGYDTDAAWREVFAHAFDDGRPQPDLVVVTGDVADHGQPEEYLVAAAHLQTIPVATNLVPGNHDFHVPFESHLPRPGLTMSRTLRLGSWLFLFADSNHPGRELDADGRLVDSHDRIEQNGGLGPREMAWLSETIGQTDADHAFIWVHHPPAAKGSFNQPAYDAEVAELIRRHAKLRGVGAGHTHTDSVDDIAGRPVFTCPALTINLDVREGTILPPGYRTYEFGDDGTISSDCHLIDDDRWPRRRLPRAAARWLAGEISFDEMQAEIARRQAEKAAQS